MIAVALKGIAGRKIRALLTAFAIVIGVSMVAGTFILTDTTQQSGYALRDSSHLDDRRRDLREAGRRRARRAVAAPRCRSPCSRRSGPCPASPTPPARSRRSWRATSPTSSAATAARPPARASPAASIPTKLQLTGSGGGVYGPLKLETGAWAKGPGQVVIDRRTAAKQHYKVGDSIVISTLGTRHTFKLAGTVSFTADDLPPRPEPRGLGHQDRAEGVRPRRPIRRDVGRPPSPVPRARSSCAPSSRCWQPTCR